MKILIRSKLSGLFLASDGTWVKEIPAARDFPGGAEAIAYASAQGLAGIELLHVFSDEKYNFTLSLRDFTQRAPRKGIDL